MISMLRSFSLGCHRCGVGPNTTCNFIIRAAERTIRCLSPFEWCRANKSIFVKVSRLVETCLDKARPGTAAKSSRLILFVAVSLLGLGPEANTVRSRGFLATERIQARARLV